MWVSFVKIIGLWTSFVFASIGLTMKKLLAGLVGFVVTFVALAVGREIYFAFKERPAPEVIGDAFDAIGSLRWIDTTLVTGLAAVAAAFVSVRAVHRQIDSDRQMEADRIAAQRAANRATLPLVLSRICRYATDHGVRLYAALEQCPGGALPRSVKLGEFSYLPEGSIADLKEFIQFSKSADRKFIADLLSDIQVQNARIEGMISDRARGRLVIADNLEEYLFDAMEIYGRASALFNYARGETEVMPSILYVEDILPALGAFGIWDFARDALIGRITRRYPSDPTRRDR